MNDSLDQLLTSCSLASRSIRLLTAETRRRAILLRACCSEYELALERLSAARDHALRLGTECEHETEELEDPDPRGHVPHAHPARPTEAASQGRFITPAHDAQDEAEAAFDGASAFAAAFRPVGFQGSLVDAVPAFQTATVQHLISQAGQGSEVKGAHSPKESSRITKSLEEILEQARSIRTRPSSKGSVDSHAVTAAAASADAAAPSRQTAATAVRRAAGTAAASSGCGLSKDATSRDRWQQSQSSVSPGRGGSVKGRRRGGLPKATPRTVLAPSGSGSARAKPKAAIAAACGDPVQSAAQGRPSRFKTGTSHSAHGQARSRPGQRSCSRGSGRRSDALGSSGASGPRGGAITTSRAGASQQRLSGPPSTALTRQPECLEHPPGKRQQKTTERGAAMTGSTQVAANLSNGMWEEVNRYEAARRRLMRPCGSSGGGGGGDGGANKISREDFEAAEQELLRGLDSDAGFHAPPQELRRDGPQPDSQFLDWRGLLSPSCSSSREDLHSQNPIGACGAGDVSGFGGVGGVGGGPRCCEQGSSTGCEESPVFHVGLERLEDVERLQWSLMMLLDEVEGRRELLACQERQKITSLAMLGGMGDGRQDKMDTYNVGRLLDSGSRPLREFEDWYSWNKVAHATGLLRENLDEMTHEMRAGVSGHSSLSEEAKSLVENPGLVLSGENPLCCVLKSYDDSVWLKDWQQSSSIQELRGTACVAVVQELQHKLPSCWPYESGSDNARGQTVEEFAEQLRAMSILAAETDISRLVLPALTRELSHARLQSWRPAAGEAPSIPAKNVGARQHALASMQTTGGSSDSAQRRMTSGAYMHDADVRCLRGRFPRDPLLPEMGAGGDAVDAETEEAVWTPALAVFRAVDAILSGGGKPRISFARRGDATAVSSV